MASIANKLSCEICTYFHMWQLFPSAQHALTQRLLILVQIVMHNELMPIEYIPYLRGSFYTTMNIMLYNEYSTSQWAFIITKKLLSQSFPMNILSLFQLSPPPQMFWTIVYKEHHWYHVSCVQIFNLSHAFFERA